MQLRLDEFDVDSERWVALSYVIPRPSILVRLTASELAVIDLYANGLSARAIARARSVSTRTIANQISAVYRKLKVKSRSELVARLHCAPTGETSPEEGAQ